MNSIINDGGLPITALLFFITIYVHFQQKQDNEKVMMALQKVNELRLDTENDTNWYIPKYYELKKIYLA